MSKRNGTRSKKNVAVPQVTMEDGVITLSGMYQDYFLDYASYVILERAVPGIGDGLKPVQRRILHALKQMKEGIVFSAKNTTQQQSTCLCWHKPSICALHLQFISSGTIANHPQ